MMMMELAERREEISDDEDTEPSGAQKGNTLAESAAPLPA